MTTTITGELTLGDERSKSLGIIMAMPALFYLIGYLLVGYIAEWRLALTYFAAPLIGLSFITSMKIIPLINLRGEKTSMSLGFKKICGGRSAISCLFTKMMGGVWIVCLSFGASFYRDVFKMPIFTVSALTAGMALIYAFGAFFGGRLIPRVGNKKTTTLTWILMGVVLIVLMNVGNVLVTVAMGFLISLISGISLTSSAGLTVSQVPEYRGSMMSLNSASANLGSSLNLALMGYMLTNYGWSYGSIVIGVLGIASGILNHLLVIEKNE